MRHWFIALAYAAQPALAANEMLHIEWRWVDSTLNAAAIGAIRDGSSTWSTAGNVTPKPGGTITSTRSAEDRVSPVQELRVLNGHEASQRFETPALIQWVEGDRNRAKLRGQPSVRVNSFAVTPSGPVALRRSSSASASPTGRRSSARPSRSP